MSIAKSTSKVQTHDDDALRAGRGERDVVAPEPQVQQAEALDVALEDPYDNVACTD